LAATKQLHDILATQGLPQITELDRAGLLGLVVVRVRGRVDGEDFVVAEGVDGLLGQEPRVVDRAMVDHLDECVVLVGDGGVVDVDQAVGAAGQQDVVTGRVI